MSDKKLLMSEIARPLSDDEIAKAVRKLGGKIKIISYPDLERYRTIDDLFQNYKYICLLYTSDPSKTGHWVLLIRHKEDEVEIFDSYGYRPDNLLKFFKKNGKEMYPLLSDLLYRSGIEKVHHMTIRLQRLRNDIGTCGRYVIVRVFYDLVGKTLKDMVRDIKRNKYFPKGHYDGWVFFMTKDLV